MTLDELLQHSADLLPQASARAIYRLGERNEARSARTRPNTLRALARPAKIAQKNRRGLCRLARHYRSSRVGK
jgi:hypothetical protein